MEITVGIPVYNEAKSIESILESLANSTYKDKEIILCANGCTDDTVKIAKNYELKIIETKVV